MQGIPVFVMYRLIYEQANSVCAPDQRGANAQASWVMSPNSGLAQELSVSADKTHIYIYIYVYMSVEVEVVKFPSSVAHSTSKRLVLSSRLIVYHSAFISPAS